MKNFFCFAILVAGLSIVAGRAAAQNKIGYISLQELITAMPEFKKANDDMADQQKALQGQATDMQAEFSRKDSIMNVDSLKWTPAMRDIKRKELNELYLKIVNFNQQAQQILAQKEQQLLAPIQQKAVQTTQAVAKENGYAYILSKEQLIAFPATDDLLPLVAKKLNLTIGGGAGGAQPPATNKPAGNKPAGRP